MGCFLSASTYQPSLLLATFSIYKKQANRQEVLHDKAFDTHTITVTEDFKIKIAASFYGYKDVPVIKQNFIDYDGKPLIEPRKFYPKAEFLQMHNEIFASK